jgi:hypothetical protein
MANFPQDFQPLDPGRVNADDPVEFAFWCWTLRCSESRLLSALERVGPHVTQLRQELGDTPDEGDTAFSHLR